MIELTIPEARRIAAVFVVLAVVALGLYAFRRRRVAAALGDRDLIRHLMGFDLARVPIARLALLALSAVLLGWAIIVAADPGNRAGSRGPVVLLLDASGSMLVPDAADGTRLDAQRRIAREVVAGLNASPVGVVAFAGRAFSLTPPTRDRAAVDMYVATVDPTIVTQSGSALSAAIRQGISLLAASGSADGGTLVLIGDGDETDDREAALEAARLARRAGVRIHTVAVGSEDGGPVPAVDLATGSTEGYLREPDGTPIESRVDLDLLRSISDRAGGIHVSAAASDASASVIRTVDETRPPGDRQRLPLYAWVAMAALLILTVEPLGELRRRS